MGTAVHLTPDLEAIARGCVAEGQYENVSEVVCAGLRILQDTEKRRSSFNAMLETVRREADRDGTYDLDSVLRELDRTLEQADR